MKTLLSLLFFSISLFANSASSALEPQLKLNLNSSVERKAEKHPQNWYATTGTTRNMYGTNYSISLRVQGYDYGGCLSISAVEASSGGGWSSVSYYSVYGESCTYSVNVGYETYYFSI